MNKLVFCPACRSDLFNANSLTSYKCKQCDFILFLNAATAVAAIIEHDQNILFTIRANAPEAGKLDLPGGFAEAEESAEQALNRELREELSLNLTSFHYLCSFPNTYRYTGVTYRTVDFFYSLKLHIIPDVNPADDVSDVVWVNKHNISFEEVAFPSVCNALDFYRSL